MSRSETARRVAGAGLMILCLALPACRDKDGQASARTERPPAPAIVGQVQAGEAVLKLQAVGHVKAGATVTLRSQVTGVLQKAHFKPGEEVKAGQQLLTIDPVPYELALKQAEANLSRDQANAEQAARQALNYESLVKTGSVSREAYNEKVTAAAAAKETVVADRAAVAIARQNLSYCHIDAPISGLTGVMLKEAGNLVKANDDQIVTLNQIEPILVRFGVPERRLAEILARRAKEEVPVEVSLPDGGPVELGVLSFIDNQVDPATGMILLEATFPNKNRRLWPGQFVTAAVHLATLREALLIPHQALQNGPQGFFVLAVKADSTVELRPVTPGPRVGESYVIAKGLAAGERVVLEGHLRLYPGARIVPQEQAAPASAPPAAPSKG